MKGKFPVGADATLLKVADAAVVWWTMHRPIQWSVEQHIANPTINCATAAEKTLAKMVAEWCALQSRG